MLVKDLIAELQKLIDNTDPIMGEAEIMIDMFELKDEEWIYRGFSPEVRITFSGDGVYPILTAIKDNQ